MDKKGFELAISTLILIIIGVLVLIGLVYALTNGFRDFKSNTDALGASESSVIKEVCRLACVSEDRTKYCCMEFKLGEGNVTCMDARLEVGCGLSCGDYNCSR